jgi:hypothetical protein
LLFCFNPRLTEPGPPPPPFEPNFLGLGGGTPDCPTLRWLCYRSAALLSGHNSSNEWERSLPTQIWQQMPREATEGILVISSKNARIHNSLPHEEWTRRITDQAVDDKNISKLSWRACTRGGGDKVVPMTLTTTRKEWRTEQWTEHHHNIIHIQLMGTNLTTHEEAAQSVIAMSQKHYQLSHYAAPEPPLRYPPTHQLWHTTTFENAWDGGMLYNSPSSTIADVIPTTLHLHIIHTTRSC